MKDSQSMDRYRTHVCLVSEQTIPNLIPALDPRSKPEKVVLLVTPQMESQADWLSGRLTRCGVTVFKESIPPYSMEGVRETVRAVIEGFGEFEPALNATGGTKLMALGALEVFLAMKRPAFYIDTSGQLYHRIHPMPDSMPLPDLARVGDCLAAYGHEIIDSKTEFQTGRNELILRMIENGPRLYRDLRRLSGLAVMAKGSLVAPLVPSPKPGSPLEELLRGFIKFGLFKIEDGVRIRFLDEAARRWTAGGWLEEHAFQACWKLSRKGVVIDALSNVTAKGAGGAVNEFDVLFTAANRLHIIECKTGRLDNQDKAVQFIYKLDALRAKVGGVFGRALLASYQPLNESERTRCQSYGIRSVEGRKLNNLGEEIRAWIGT